jgi:hypothetical protein
MKRDRVPEQLDEGDPRLARLEAEARHAGDRFRLYRARSLGPSATSRGRLDELERESEAAAGRYRRALELAREDPEPRR